MKVMDMNHYVPNPLAILLLHLNASYDVLITFYSFFLMMMMMMVMMMMMMQMMMMMMMQMHNQ